jgi:hypothetical protein
MSKLEGVLLGLCAAMGLTLLRSSFFLRLIDVRNDPHEERSSRKGSSPIDPAIMLIANSFAQQNQAMMGFILSNQEKLINRLIEETDNDVVDINEISCKGEHVETIRALMDESAERTVKELATWAASALSGFNLKLEEVSLEPDSSIESGSAYDVLVIFRVIGNGDDALRFHTSATRKLRDIVGDNFTESVRRLRPEVRWQ